MIPRQIYLFLLVLILLNACAALPFGSLNDTEREKLYLQALDEITTTGNSPALGTLQRDYPRDPWTKKANDFVLLVHAHELHDKKIRVLQQERDRSVRENERLLKEIRLLKDDLEKLKTLVIEMEKRRR